MRGEFVILDRSGHSTLEWDTADEASVDRVRRRFEEVVADGYLIYAVDSNGSGTQVKSSDEVVAAEQVIAHHPLVGG
jgi:hypothetical protein